MNKTKIKEEGFDLKAIGKFGIVTKLHNWSQPLIELYYPENQLDFKLYYRVTMDGYIQIIGNFPDNENSWIITQKKRTSIELLSQLKELTRLIIMKCSNDQFGTYFTYRNSELISKECFDSMQYYSYLELFNELSIDIESFKIIKTLRKFDLNPVPSLSSKKQWIADCPNCNNHLTIIHDLDYWECDNCEFEGSSIDVEDLIKRAEMQRRLVEINRKLEVLLNKGKNNARDNSLKIGFLIDYLKQRLQDLLDFLRLTKSI